MSKFKVCQINGRKHPREAADAMMSGIVKTVDIKKFWDAGLYDKVAEVEAISLEGVFTIMNRWSDQDEFHVTRLAPLHSLSVGDVVIDDKGEAYIVASFGFDKFECSFVL